MRRKSCSFCLLWLINIQSVFFFFSLNFLKQNQKLHRQEKLHLEREMSERGQVVGNGNNRKLCHMLASFFMRSTDVVHTCQNVYWLASKKIFKSSLHYANFKIMVHVFWWKKNYLIWLLSWLYPYSIHWVILLQLLNFTPLKWDVGTDI